MVATGCGMNEVKENEIVLYDKYESHSDIALHTWQAKNDAQQSQAS